MSKRKRSFFKRAFGALLIFLVVGAGVFFGVQYFTKTGFFRIPGVVYYDESLNADEKSVLESIFTVEIDLDKDVIISAKYTLEKPALEQGEYVYDIQVPVTDFYSTDTDITADEVDNLFADPVQSDIAYTMMSVTDLNFQKKLLSLNGSYYLDEFNKGAAFRIVKFESEKFEEEIKPLVDDAFTKSFPEKETVLAMAQTGVTALSRGMNQKLVQVGGDATYFAENIKDFLSSFDLTHTSNESSFTTFANSSNICSDTRFINTLTAIGLDIVELTGNHNQDCGDEAALNSIDMYEQNNIRMVGGGRSAEEAAKPLLINEEGSGITFLAYNLSTGGATYDGTPGANQYYEENAAAEIAAAKERGDFVLIDIQYYECSAYASEYEDATCDRADSAAGDQVGFFRHLIDMGADMIVGTSAHQPQTFELYGDGVIYYGLGNLFFDQIWWPGTTRSLILGNYFYQGKLLQTKITPTVYDSSMQTRILDAETAKWFLDRLISVKP